MPWHWYEYVATVRRSTATGAPNHEYLFPGQESPSPAAEQLIEDCRALEKRISKKYGEDQNELPYEEWVIWRGLMAGVSNLPAAEQRYFWRRLSGEGSENG